MQKLEKNISIPKGLPQNAKCVFEGILFDTWQWEQELFDGSFTTFEAIVRIGSTQIILIDENNKIILYEEEQPLRGKFISMPGGQLDKEDLNPETGAKRELIEEMGMVGELELLFEGEISSEIIWPTYYFVSRNSKVICENRREAGEKINPIYLSFEEFIEHTQREDFRNKYFQNYIYKLIQDKRVDEFKEKIFEN